MTTALEAVHSAHDSVRRFKTRYYREIGGLYMNSWTRQQLITLATYKDDPDDPGPRSTIDTLFGLPVFFDPDEPDGSVRARDARFPWLFFDGAHCLKNGCQREEGHAGPHVFDYSVGPVIASEFWEAATVDTPPESHPENVTP